MKRVFLFILIFGCIVFLVVRAKIKTIEVVGEPALVVVNEQYISKSLVFFPSARTAEKIKKDNPLVSAVWFEKKFPSTLVIHIAKRKPFAILESHGYRYSIDRNNVVLEINASQSTMESFPVISIPLSMIRIGSTIVDSRVIQATRFLSNLPDTISISSITELDRVSLIAKYNTTDIVFPQQGEVTLMIDTLQTLIAGFTIKGIMPKYIDLRYTKPIVHF